VIVSADRFNDTALNTITVTSVFSNMQYARHAGNVVLPASTTGLNRDSVANVTQTGAIDRKLLIQRIGAVPPSLMRDIDAGLRLALQL
jgi:mRNA interferase MazF